MLICGEDCMRMQPATLFTGLYQLPPCTLHLANADADTVHLTHADADADAVHPANADDVHLADADAVHLANADATAVYLANADATHLANADGFANAVHAVLKKPRKSTPAIRT
jgi:hypothetical protein